MAYASLYSRRKVSWLLSMTRDQAIAHDAAQRDSCAGLAASNEGGGSPGASDPDLPVIAQWNDVQRARRDTIKEKEGLAILQLRAQGFSELALAEMSGRDRLALRRRWHATVEEILERLGGVQVPDAVIARVRVCIKCGTQPRVRLNEVGLGQGRDSAREASTCAACIDPELSSRIVGDLVAAA